jgi:hypothetical protein
MKALITIGFSEYFVCDAEKALAALAVLAQCVPVKQGYTKEGYTYTKDPKKEIKVELFNDLEVGEELSE